MRNILLIVLLPFILLSCAGQRAPEGGPIDTDPPTVASTIPANYATRFSGRSITLEFNEYVDHRSVEGAVFVSPSLGQLEFDWSGREVEIRFAGTLRRSTTYVVTIGTDVVDLHNRNKMAQSYTLAFTTGEDIDHGAVEGRVFPRRETDPALGAMIFAYRLDGLNPDTLDPRTTKPDYVTQSGKDGGFLLRHLTFGSYRIIAVRDDYKNLLYDPETDEFGAQPDEIVLTPTDTLKAGVWMRLGKEDTTAVRMTKAASTNNRHVMIELSSPMDTSGLSANWFRVSDTVSQKPLGVLSVCPVIPKMTSVVVVTDTQRAGEGYRVEISSLRGVNGLRVSPSANRLTFSGSEVRDTLAPRIASISLADSAKEIDLQPKFLLSFSDAVKRERAGNSISLIDSSRSAVPLRLRWLSDASVEVMPQGRLASRTWFTLRIGMRSVMNLAGRAGKDSLRVFRFQTIDDELFSSIEGFIHDVSVSDPKGDVFLVARNVSRKEPKEYVVRLSQPGPFMLSDLLEGKYLLQAFRDRDDDGKFSPGQVFPFRRSERFTEYPDTLRLRARWPLENVELKLH
ncbi:MAG: Ig-like domain-containing protein [Ignavibacteriales bacterium]|nr:Ig-like domain-containing protein [Ignavibacteriales bacterium]